MLLWYQIVTTWIHKDDEDDHNKKDNNNYDNDDDQDDGDDGDDIDDGDDGDGGDDVDDGDNGDGDDDRVRDGGDDLEKVSPKMFPATQVYTPSSSEVAGGGNFFSSVSRYNIRENSLARPMEHFLCSVHCQTRPLASLSHFRSINNFVSNGHFKRKWSAEGWSHNYVLFF